MGKLRDRVRNDLHDIWEFDSPAWAELLLGSLKLALGLASLLSINNSALVARYDGNWEFTALIVGIGLLILGLAQIAGVLLMVPSLRKVALLVGMFFWVFYAVLMVLLGGAVPGLLVYVPLVVFNVLALRRLVGDWGWGGKNRRNTKTKRDR